MLEEDQLDQSILAVFGKWICWIFAPLGFGTWQATVAAITGLIAKENIVGTMGILYSGTGTVYSNLAMVFTPISGYAFLVFNLLCAPCFAAMGAIKREMNNGRWTGFAITYQCIFAYLVGLVINQVGNFVTGNGSIIGMIAAVVIIAVGIYWLVKPTKNPAKIANK
jgi:ferrous iron transport protein B